MLDRHIRRLYNNVSWIPKGQSKRSYKTSGSKIVKTKWGTGGRIVVIGYMDSAISCLRDTISQCGFSGGSSTICEALLYRLEKESAPKKECRGRRASMETYGGFQLFIPDAAWRALRTTD